ncbi:FxsB family cyclophane-forming radical SAM/SPASM peptide maturase [Streptomyces griseorubiginosus]|uniref:Anaerobic sulfatase-maturating enzyme n=1 Tax=Streptomyces griseorubiginosus TaxID=67304 RepID=A0AAI8PP99_9ACTN|nr:FxsB family cyclophane-forming radical SAM/SPASM peptide maturase [Streptomyces griseorubiginosus]AYC40099.1 Anaerobic sulfatase-maturating enzyme [Streptomyces griseorubiginosus]
MRKVRPFREWVVKVAQHCNLACDHCYVYELQDSSWRRKPRVLPEESVVPLAERIAEHARNHALPEVRVVLHGGEPLLAGKERIENLVSVLTNRLQGVADCDISVQSNGTLLDPDWLDLFRRHGVSVGVSLDGGRGANDRHRRSRNGRSSYTAVLKGLELLRRPEHRALYSGLLCTVDLDNDPVAVYEQLLAHRPPMIDLLLPHSTWEHPPPGRDGSATPYADWLLAVFERWYSAPVRETRIRRFEQIMERALGAQLAPAAPVQPTVSDHIVVESDLSVELPDSLKAAYDGAAATGLNLRDHDFDTVARHPKVVAARGAGPDPLAADCVTCPVVRLCGGGLRAHRFHPRNGFHNPSVFCADLRLLTTHIRDRVAADVREWFGEAS